MVLVVKNPPASTGDVRDASSIPGSERSPGGGHGNSLVQYSFLENPMERGAWWSMVHRVTNSQTWLKWLSTLQKYITSNSAIKIIINILQIKIIINILKASTVREREVPDVQADFRKAEEQEIKVPTSAGSSKNQESSRKTSISALLTVPKPLTVWITINCGKFWKRGEYQTTWPASWEICMQVRKKQLELDMEQQTGSK